MSALLELAMYVSIASHFLHLFPSILLSYVDEQKSFFSPILIVRSGVQDICESTPGCHSTSFWISIFVALCLSPLILCLVAWSKEHFYLGRLEVSTLCLNNGTIRLAAPKLSSISSTRRVLAASHFDYKLV